MNDFKNNQTKSITQVLDSNFNSRNLLSKVTNNIGMNAKHTQCIKRGDPLKNLELIQNYSKQTKLENKSSKTQNEKIKTLIEKDKTIINEDNNHNTNNINKNDINNNIFDKKNVNENYYYNNNLISKKENAQNDLTGTRNINQKTNQYNYNNYDNMNNNTNETQKSYNNDNNKLINLNNMISNIKNDNNMINNNLEYNKNMSSQMRNNGKIYNENKKINNNNDYNINSNNNNNFDNNKQKNEQQFYNNINNNNDINKINENIMINQMNNPNFNININPINQNVVNDKIISNQNNNYSFSRYTKASQTGLVNIYDTSYLNSVLQLLGSIRNIASYFLNPKHQKIIVDDIKHYPLSFVFYRLFLHLYPYPETDNREVYKPDSLLEVLGILNVVYKTTKARNPNELISFILNTLHKEININKNNKFQPPNYNIYDKKSVISAGISYFQKSDNSVISNILNWFEIKELRCNKCNQIVYNFNTFNTFELDILGAYQCKKNPITLNECLYYYGKEKAQDLYCIKCGKYNKITYKSNILSSSYMIIFSLNRGELDKNNLIHIPFHLEDKIDLSFFIEKESPKHYELTGIVSIVKEQNKYKYVSFCRSPVDHQWYLYNDEIIGKPQLNDIINAHNNNKYIPCILAYTQY